VVDEITDSDGDRIAVETMGPNVYLTATSKGFAACVRLDADARDRFARAWAEAGRRAEACAAEQVVEAEIWCGLPGGCVRGAEEHLFGDACQSAPI